MSVFNFFIPRIGQMNVRVIPTNDNRFGVNYKEDISKTTLCTRNYQYFFLEH